MHALKIIEHKSVGMSCNFDQTGGVSGESENDQDGIPSPFQKEKTSYCFCLSLICLCWCVSVPLVTLCPLRCLRLNLKSIRHWIRNWTAQLTPCAQNTSNSVILRDAVHIGACPFLTFFLKNLQRFSYDLGRSDVGGVHVTVRVGSTQVVRTFLKHFEKCGMRHISSSKWTGHAQILRQDTLSEGQDPSVLSIWRSRNRRLRVFDSSHDFERKLVQTMTGRHSSMAAGK